MYLYIVVIIIWRSLKDISIAPSIIIILPHGWFVFKLYPYTVRRWSREMPRNEIVTKSGHTKNVALFCTPQHHSKKRLMSTPKTFRTWSWVWRINKELILPFLKPFQSFNLSSKDWRFIVPFFAWYYILSDIQKCPTIVTHFGLLMASCDCNISLSALSNWAKNWSQKTAHRAIIPSPTTRTQPSCD